MLRPSYPALSHMSAVQHGYWFGQLCPRLTIVPVRLLSDVSSFEHIGYVDVPAWIPHDYNHRAFVDSTSTQLRVDSANSPGFTFVFLFEQQKHANLRWVNMPLH